MPVRIFATKYMTRFQCIADRCEDICCAGMTIAFSRTDHDKLELAMSESEPERAEFAANVMRGLESIDGNYARLVMNGQKECTFLQRDRLCSVMRRYGEPTLPDPCSIFPRVLNYFGNDRIEVSATLACPESARLCLLADDSMDVIEAPPLTIARLPAPRQCAEQGAGVEPEPYDSYALAVQWCIRDLLSTSYLRIGERLVLLASLAEEIGVFFHRGTECFEGELRVTSETSLMEALMRARSPEVQYSVLESCAQQEIPGPLIIQAVLAALLRVEGLARYRLLLSGCYESYAAAAKALHGAELTTNDWDTLWYTFIGMRSQAEVALGSDIETVLVRYALNDWRREMYFNSETLASHVSKVALRILTLRFLIMGHPGVHALISVGPTTLGAAQRAQFDESVVEAVQIFAKYVERSGVIECLYQELRGQAADITKRLSAVAIAKAC